MSDSLAKPDFDVVVIGGGAVGLSVGYHCSLKGYSTAVIERHEQFFEEASTHNSGVIHSGFNPTPGTLKAVLNAEGARMMYEKSEEWRFGTRRTGTIVAAVNRQERQRLLEIKNAGEKNGVTGLKLLTRRELKDIEPGIENATEALYSPDGGVVDITEYLARLKARAANEGAVLASGRGVVSIRGRELVELSLSDREKVTARHIVNSAGMHSDDIAALTGSSYRIYPCVGEYAFVEGEGSELVRGMVYPVVGCGSPGLGIHLTKTYDGLLQVGPTAVYGTGKDPVVWKRTGLEEFIAAIHSFLPSVEPSAVREGWYGVRAKTVPPGGKEGFGDFIIEWDRGGFPAIHLVGIESPGLTSSLAIGNYVARMIAERSGSNPAAL